MLDVRNVTYAREQTIEVCVGLALPPTRRIRRIVAVFVDEHGEAIELTDDVPARVSECVLQDPSQSALRGRAAHPGV